MERRGERYDCGGLPWVASIKTIMSQREAYMERFKGWERCHRLIGHINDVTLDRYPVRVGAQYNTDLRIKFLGNEIDDDEWIARIRLRQKRNEKNQEIRNILTMFTTTITDIFQLFMVNTEININNQVNTLRSYVNSELIKVSRRYNNNVLQISPTWKIT
jgi:hypothetical protein